MSDTSLSVWSLFVLLVRTEIFKKGQISQRKRLQKPGNGKEKLEPSSFLFIVFQDIFGSVSFHSRERGAVKAEEMSQPFQSGGGVGQPFCALFDTLGQRYPADN